MKNKTKGILLLILLLYLVCSPIGFFNGEWIIALLIPTIVIILVGLGWIAVGYLLEDD